MQYKLRRVRDKQTHETWGVFGSCWLTRRNATPSTFPRILRLPQGFWYTFTSSYSIKHRIMIPGSLDKNPLILNHILKTKFNIWWSVG